jgi:hypothetical protein
MYTLTVTVIGNGSVSQVEGEYSAGEKVTITAMPGESYVVAAWDGTDDDNSDSTVNTVTMTENKTVYVIFLLSHHGEHITNIDNFLDTCPQDDPAYELIRHDFDILFNGVPVEEVSCSGPVSTLPQAEFTDELILLQALRTIYHMDHGQAGHLPWTGSTLYRWMREKIDGFDIRTDIQYTYCCEIVDGKMYVALASLQGVADIDVFRTWRGIAAEIGLLAHETRHVDGYLHTSCCGINGGCDDHYDESNLSSYGIQWFLNKAWLSGEINIGIACLTQDRIDTFAQRHQNQCNRTLSRRFCYTQPPLLEHPQQPGGPCL